MIDQRAIVDATAVLGSGVTVGAFSIIEPHVTIGDNTRIDAHTIVRRNSLIGKDNHIHSFCSIGDDPQFSGYQGEETFLDIGHRNQIREFCTLNRGSPAGTGRTSIGNDNFLMAYVHIAHDSGLGNNITLANAVSLAGHVEIGDGATLGGFSLVHQFCRIGQHAFTGIGTICLKDIPPFVMAAGHSAVPYGINVRGLRRRGFDAESVTALQRAYRHLYRSGLDLKAALVAIERDGAAFPVVAALCAFVKSSTRGIVR